MINNFMDISESFVDNSIEQGIEIAKGNRKHLDGEAIRLYFLGQGLCIDTKDEFGQMCVITLSHNDETFGLFSGDTRRRLLSIKTMKRLEELMKLCIINHEPKFNK